MNLFARINLSSVIRRKRVHGAEADLQAVNGGNGMCNYPVSNIQYPISSIHYSMMAGQIGCWLLDIGCLHIQHMLSFPSHGAGEAVVFRRGPLSILAM